MDALYVFFLKLGVDVLPAVETQRNFCPFKTHPRRYHFRFQLHHSAPESLVLNYCLALSEERFILFCLSHHLTQVHIQLHYPITIFFLFGQRCAIGTFSLFCCMDLVPRTIALIAKLALAKTLHMRTAHLLLNGLPAFGTLPRVIANPVGIGLFRADESVPSLDVIAGDRIMGFFLAAIAVQLSAGTCDSIELHHVRLHTEVRTLLVGTVTDVLVLHSVTHTTFLPVQLRQLWSHQIDKTSKHWGMRTWWNLHTTGKDAS